MKTVIFHNHPIHYKHLLFREMAIRGLDFTVLFGGTESNIRSEKVRLSQDLYKYTFLHDGPIEAAPALLRIVRSFQVLRELRPRIIISCGYERPENWVAWLWGLWHRAPVILWYESNQFDWPRYWWKELPKRFFMKGLSGAHVYGRTHRDYLAKLGLNPNSILLKRSVADVTKFSLPMTRRYRVAGTTHLLYIGRLAAEKNVAFLIQSYAAAKKLAGNDLKLTIIGTGPDEAIIKQLITTLNLSDSVTLAGYVPQAELLPYLTATDVFILPSIREPWGLVVLEAMLARIPVLVSTQCGCAADVVTPETGWSFSPWNARQLTTLLSALPNIPGDRLREMGNAAHDLAVKHSPKNSAEVIVTSIRDLPKYSNRVSVLSGSIDALHAVQDV